MPVIDTTYKAWVAAGIPPACDVTRIIVDPPSPFGHDIDSDRLFLHIHGKGSKDRYVPLPTRTLELLRQLCRRSGLNSLSSPE